MSSAQEGQKCAGDEQVHPERDAAQSKVSAMSFSAATGDPERSSCHPKRRWQRSQTTKTKSKCMMQRIILAVAAF
jgi:hypothetical protein